MRKSTFRPLHLLPVIALIVLGTILRDPSEPQLDRRPTSLPKAQLHRPSRKVPLPRLTRAPASVRILPESDFDKLVKVNIDIKLPRGNMLAENIGAKPLKEFGPGDPAPIYSNGVYGFFEKKAGERSAIPVAYNPALKVFYPISSVIHLRNVDEGLRQQLLGQGYQEYVYFKAIKKLSLKSTPEKVVELYSQLEKSGYPAKLEVLQHRPVAH